MAALPAAPRAGRSLTGCDALSAPSGGQRCAGSRLKKERPGYSPGQIFTRPPLVEPPQGLDRGGILMELATNCYHFVTFLSLFFRYILIAPHTISAGNQNARGWLRLTPRAACSTPCDRCKALQRENPLFSEPRDASRARLEWHGKNAGRAVMNAQSERNHATKAPAELINVWHSA
jgi:hypothetical protein